MHDALRWMERELESLDNRQLRRRLATRHGKQAARIVHAGRDLLNFSSNDYLALAADSRLIDAATRAAGKAGWGSGSSALISGHSRFHAEFEARLAEFEGTEAALVFPSGYAANTGTVAALAGPGDVVYSDRKNHASLLDGCRLSRADVRVYPHNDCGPLERLLDKSASYRRRLIVTDGLFSMDGDIAPLPELCRLAQRYDAMLLVDEAHATGVLGREGRGVAEQWGVEDRVPVRVGTLSKALGSMGGFVAGSRSLIEWLVNRARPYLFSTAMPPALAAAAMVALQVVQCEPQRRATLLQRATDVRTGLESRGWNVGRSSTQIIPVIVGGEDRALALAAALKERGLFVPAIRRPTVPEGEATLRISLTCGHTPEMVDTLLSAFESLKY